MDKSRDEAVRRLLAEARHDEPMPAEVVARLDRVLADLGEEPARVRPVTDLATRRRRVTRMLVAAAAVVVVGVGVQQVISPQSGDEDSGGSSTTAERESADHAPANGAGNSEKPEEGAEAFDAQSPSQANRRTLTGLTSSDFSDEVTRVRDGKEYARRVTVSALRDSLTLAYEAAGQACGAGTWGRGTFVPVLYDESPAVLVFRRARGDTQVADLFLCGDTEPVRSVTLPAP